MKTCVMACHTHPWSNTSKPSSKSLCEVLQKRQLGLHVKQYVSVLSLDYVFQRVFGHRDKFLKDLNLLKESTTCWYFIVVDFNIFKTGWANGISKPLFKSVIQSGRLQTTLQIRWTTCTKDKLLSVDFKALQIRELQKISNLSSKPI